MSELREQLLAIERRGRKRIGGFTDEMLPIIEQHTAEAVAAALERAANRAYRSKLQYDGEKGGAKAIRDSVRTLIPDTQTALAEHDKVKDAEIEQLRTQLAGCSVAALGYAKGKQDCKQGDYGWSASFGDVKELRRKYEELLAMQPDYAKIIRQDDETLQQMREKESQKQAERERAVEAAALREVESWQRKLQSAYAGGPYEEDELLRLIVKGPLPKITPTQQLALDRELAKARLDEAILWAKNQCVLDSQSMEWRRKRIAKLEAQVKE